MCFRIMHIDSKFQIFIHIFTVVKLENKTPAFKKLGLFCNFFKVKYLNELITYKLHTNVKLMLIILSMTYKKILRLLKHLTCQNIERVESIFRKLSDWWQAGNKVLVVLFPALNNENNWLKSLKPVGGFRLLNSAHIRLKKLVKYKKMNYHYVLCSKPI